jgi:antitoxin ParD1/3/4
MADADLKVSLPPRLRQHVEQRIAEGAYSDASDFLRALIREDMRRHTPDRIEALLLEGLDSGEPEPLDEAEWASIRQEVEERVAARRGAA